MRILQALAPVKNNSFIQVLDGNQIAAKLLAENVHADTSALPDAVAKDLGKLPEKSDSLPIEEFGIWIDPIGMYSRVPCHTCSSIP